MCMNPYHSISCAMLVFRHTLNKHRKGFANHFVLLLQFHESRNASERERGGHRGGEGGEREQRDREREIVEALVGPTTVALITFQQ